MTAEKQKPRTFYFHLDIREGAGEREEVTVQRARFEVQRAEEQSRARDWLGTDDRDRDEPDRPRCEVIELFFFSFFL